MLIEWTQDLSVNNATLDQQHQKWIQLLDDFYTGIKEGKSREVLEQLILGMLDYTKYHFAQEEKYMESIGYPHLEAHKKLHADYIAKIEEYHQRIVDGKLIISLEVTSYLKTWLLNHIKGEDQRYAAHKH